MDDWAMVLGLKGRLVDLLPFFVPISSQALPVGTELAYFSCHPRQKALLHLQRSSKDSIGSCCEELLGFPPVFL